MKRYRCQFPFCEYETDVKSHINTHHIIPQEIDGTNDKWNLFRCCPNHHNMIYVPSATSGIHTINSEDSIELLGWVNISGIMYLHFKNYEGEVKFYDPYKRELL